MVDSIKDGHFFQIMVDNIMLTCYTLDTKCNIFVTNLIVDFLINQK